GDGRRTGYSRRGRGTVLLRPGPGARREGASCMLTQAEAVANPCRSPVEPRWLVISSRAAHPGWTGNGSPAGPGPCGADLGLRGLPGATREGCSQGSVNPCTSRKVLISPRIRPGLRGQCFLAREPWLGERAFKCRPRLKGSLWGAAKTAWRSRRKGPGADAGQLRGVLYNNLKEMP